MASDAQDNKETVAEFREAVNLTARQLSDFLQTAESRRVGYKAEGESESVGHHAGELIVGILHKKTAEYTDEDYAHMRKVVGYIRRHMAQKPDGDVSDTNWRYSLMNWGHDPLKGDK